ncbi:MAG: histidine phosphatase family protein [Pseudomonadota bacterium]
MRLILIRHPQPLVAPGICYGGTDLAVAADEVARVHAALRASLPAGAPIYSSPLRRCAELAKNLGTPILDPRLAEMHFGAWEMRSWDDIARAEIDAWAADLVHYRPGGGENVLQVATRVAAFHAELARLPHEQVVVICHAGTIRLLTACRAGRAPADIALAAARAPHAIAYGGTTILEACS